MVDSKYHKNLGLSTHRNWAEKKVKMWAKSRRRFLVKRVKAKSPRQFSVASLDVLIWGKIIVKCNRESIFASITAILSGQKDPLYRSTRQWPRQWIFFKKSKRKRAQHQHLTSIHPTEVFSSNREPRTHPLCDIITYRVFHIGHQAAAKRSVVVSPRAII